MKMQNKKGQVNALLAGGVSFVLAFLLLTVGASVGGDILTNIQADQTANSAAANITQEGLDGITRYSNQFSTVGLVAGAALIISVLVGGFAAVRGA